jgi:hypothetical protein
MYSKFQLHECSGPYVVHIFDKIIQYVLHIFNNGIGCNVYFLQSFCKFSTSGTRKLAPPKKRACQLTCTIKNLTCSVTCEEKSHTSIDTLGIETTRTTRHVTLKKHYGKNVEVD